MEVYSIEDCMGFFVWDSMGESFMRGKLVCSTYRPLQQSRWSPCLRRAQEVSMGREGEMERWEDEGDKMPIWMLALFIGSGDIFF